jgi:serine/threonine-protein kinase
LTPFLGRLAQITLASGLALTIAAAVYVREHARASAAEAFRARADTIATELERALSLPIESLYAVNAYFDANPEPTEDAFQRFVRPLLARRPSLAALEWGVVVKGEDRDSFERALSTRTSRPFSIREPDEHDKWSTAARRDWYAPLVLLEPDPFDLRGLDLAFRPERRAVVEEALGSGAMYATHRTRLVEDPPGVHSIVIYLPSYVGSPTTREARWNALRGFGVALYRIDPLVKAAVRSADLGASSLALIDRSAEADHAPSLLYESTAGAEHPAKNALSLAHPIDFGGRSWEILVSETPRPNVSFWGTILAGTIASLLLSAIAGLWSTSRRLRKAYTRVKSLGEYTLVREIKSGGMGRVYEARHALLRRRAAIKLMKGDHRESDVRRFDREAKTTSELTHPNTVTLFDYGRTSEGEFYYVMELIDGISLEELVRAHGAQPPARVRFLLLQVCASLAEAHERGFVHRDIKPANIMLCVRGGQHDFVKVLDFGLVRDHDAGDAQITRVGAMVGTLRYMAPECFTTTQPVTPRADLYAVGCVAYFLLTGRNAFEAKTDVALMAAHVASKPAPMEGVPEALATIVMKCLEKNPDARFASAAQLALALERASIGVWTELDAADWWRDNKTMPPPAPPESTTFGSRSISLRTR